MRCVSLLLGGLLSAALAQNSGQAALPPCLLNNCEENATKTTGCADSDVYCHCINQAPIYKVILPCAQRYCSDPSGSVLKYNQLFGGACSQFNITVPAPGVNGTISNSTANGSLPSASAPSSQTGQPLPSIATGDGSIAVASEIWTTVRIIGFVMVSAVGLAL